MADVDSPATKKDLQELGVRFDQRLKDIGERLCEQMRDVQTELLKAFLPWQEQVRAA